MNLAIGRNNLGRALLILFLPLYLAGCGINDIPTKDEQVKAAWGDVQNQYQRRADLVPNLVATVQGYAGTNLDGNNVFYVDTVGGQAMSIQSAINTAAAGATINVGAGTYTDALNIGKNVDIEGAGSANTIIQPTALLTTGVGHKYDGNVNTAVYVHDANDVTINGVTIDANNLGANAVVFWNNASGTISNAVIENPMAYHGSRFPARK